MSKYTMAGLASWLFSGLILLFQTISSVMGMEEKFAFKSLSLVSVVGQDHFKWIESISWAGIQNAVRFSCYHAVIYSVVLYRHLIFFNTHGYKQIINELLG